jgi:hypothetical protein
MALIGIFCIYMILGWIFGFAPAGAQASDSQSFAVATADEVSISTTVIDTNETAQAKEISEQIANLDSLQAERDKLQSELASLSQQKSEIEQQIQNTKDLEYQLEQEQILTQIEIERQERQSQIEVIQAQAQAQAVKYQAEIEAANLKATQQVEIANAETQAEIERNKEKSLQQQKIDKALYGSLQILMAAALIGLLAILFFIVSWFRMEGIKRHNLRMANLNRQQSATQVEPNQMPQDIQAKTARMLSRAITYWNTKTDAEGEPINGREQKQIPSYNNLGMSGANWMELTDYLVKLHLAEKSSGGGGGTFFRYGTLHDWLLAALRGDLERPDPLRINATPSPPDLDV